MANALRQRTAGALVTGGSSTGAQASHLPGHTGGEFSLRKVLHESVTDGAQLLLLGLTFPLNILFGIPLYLSIAHQVLG